MQGHMIVRLVWPDMREWGWHKSKRTYSDVAKSRLNWRRLIKAHKMLRRQFPDSKLGPPYLPDGYSCKYYLDGLGPLAIFEWPCRWMKERERTAKISSYLGRKKHIAPRWY